MENEEVKEKICEKCNKAKKDISYSEKNEIYLCHSCWKRHFWKPKLITCLRCKRQKIHQAKGLCPDCYNSTFFIERTRELNAKQRHNIDTDTYRKLISKCIICGFDKIVDIHHLDHDHKNNSSDNLTGLCPNHHKMLHSKKHQKEVFDILREKGFKVPEPNLSDGFFRRSFS